MNLLVPQARLELSPQGPAFRLLGGGRLAEIEEEPPARDESPREKEPPSEPVKKRKSPYSKNFFPVDVVLQPLARKTI